MVLPGEVPIYTPCIRWYGHLARSTKYLKCIHDRVYVTKSRKYSNTVALPICASKYFYFIVLFMTINYPNDTPRNLIQHMLKIMYFYLGKYGLDQYFYLGKYGLDQYFYLGLENTSTDRKIRIGSVLLSDPVI